MGARSPCGSQRLPYQLELASAAEGFPDPRVSPECAQGWHVELEGGRLHRQPCLVLEGHQKHPVLLVLRVLPGNAKLVPSVHKYPRALEESENRRRLTCALSPQRRPLALATTAGHSHAIKFAASTCFLVCPGMSVWIPKTTARISERKASIGELQRSK